jgi:hypothetical protein
MCVGRAETHIKSYMDRKKKMMTLKDEKGCSKQHNTSEELETTPDSDISK